MPAKIRYLCFALLLLVGAVVSRPFSTVKADVGGYPALPLEDLPEDIDTFAGAGAIAFLVWDWDGSVAGGGEVCDILREKSAEYPGVIFGTNVYNLADTGQASAYLTNLKNNCNGTMIRFWAANPATSTLSLTAPEIRATLDAAQGAGVQAIIPIGDFGGFLNFQQQWVLEPAIDWPNPLGWYSSRYIEKGYPAHLAELLSAVGGHSALWGVELANEAHCADHTDAVGAYNSWAGAMSLLAKTYTSANVGVGQMNSHTGSVCDYPSGNFATLHSSGFPLNVASGHFYTEDQRANVLAALNISPVPFYVGEAGYDDERSDLRCTPTSGTYSSEYKDWHTLRPFPLCPWNPVSNPNDLQYYMCGHDLVTKESFSISFEDRESYYAGPGNIFLNKCTTEDTESAIIWTCNFDVRDRAIGIKANIDKLDFPVMGLTEPEYVANIADQSTDNISHQQKMNEYVSWYMNGVTGRGEYTYPKKDGEGELLPEYKELTIDRSGPLRKQLPWRIQIGERVEQVLEARNRVSAASDYKQIIGCIVKNRVDIRSYLPFAWTIPIPIKVATGYTPDSCIAEYRTSSGDPERKYLHDWAVGISADNSNVGEGDLVIPPFEENFTDSNGKLDFTEYWQAYQDWRGQDCLGLFGDLYICVDLPFDLNYKANMFYYIPFTSVDDIIGKGWTDSTYTEQPPSSINISGVSFVPTASSANSTDGVDRYLYFPHMQEGAELAQLDQTTYVPYEYKTNWLDDEGYRPQADETRNQVFDTDACELVVDDLHPGERLQGGIDAGDDQYGIEGDLIYSGAFTCTWQELKQVCDNAWPGQTHCNTELCQPFTCQDDGSWEPAGDVGAFPCEGVPGACVTHSFYNPPPIGPDCSINVSVAMSMYDAVPKIQEVFDRYVNGGMSIFKRIYPKIGQAGGVLEEILDLPIASHYYANYSSTSPYTGSLTTLAGDPNMNRSGNQAEWYWPHLGSVYYYFTKGVQYAYRPKELIEYVLPSNGEIEIGPGDGSSGTDGGSPGSVCSQLTIDIAYRDRGAAVADKQIFLDNLDKFDGQLLGICGFSPNIISLIKENFNAAPGGSFSDYTTRFDAVVGACRDAGYNPNFCLAIWLEESAAGVWNNEFGCGSTNTFETSFQCFLDRYEFYSTSSLYPACNTDGLSFKEFMSIYSEGNCNPSTMSAGFCLNPNFPGRIQTIYNAVINPSQSSNPGMVPPCIAG